MDRSSEADANLAARVWRRMFAVLLASSDARAESLARRGLTPNDARALWSLDLEAGRPIGELAKQWACDPSNATFIVDRLEKAGLAVRAVSSRDRRVKLVRLTPAGAQTRAELDAEYGQPPPEIVNLACEDLETLDRLLASIPLPPAGTSSRQDLDPT